MIMRARVNETFTFPKQVKTIIIKNFDIVRGYFNKSIIDSNKLPLCTLQNTSHLQNPQLNSLVKQIDIILNKLPLEAYCITRVEMTESVAEKGLKVPNPYKYTAAVCRCLSSFGYSKTDLKEIRSMIADYPKDIYYIPFHMPYNKNHLNNQYMYFGGHISEAIFLKRPEVLNCLEKYGTPIQVKCIIRYCDFDDNDKINFIIELIKHYGYDLISDYYYPITLNGVCRKSITANRILEVINI